MAGTVDSLLRRWEALSAAIRRYPLLDYVMASMLIGWALFALLSPASIVRYSHFGSLHANIRVAGLLELGAGLGQASGAWIGRPQWRRRTAFVALWGMLALWFAAGSVAGKIFLGGHVVTDLMICLALVP